MLNSFFLFALHFILHFSFVKFKIFFIFIETCFSFILQINFFLFILQVKKSFHNSFNRILFLIYFSKTIIKNILLNLIFLKKSNYKNYHNSNPTLAVTLNTKKQSFWFHDEHANHSAFLKDLSFIINIFEDINISKTG